MNIVRLSFTETDSRHTDIELQFDKQPPIQLFDLAQLVIRAANLRNFNMNVTLDPPEYRK